MPGERHRLGGSQPHNKARGPATATNGDLQPPPAGAPRSPRRSEEAMLGRAASSRGSSIAERRDSRGGGQSSPQTPEPGRVRGTVINYADK